MFFGKRIERKTIVTMSAATTTAKPATPKSVLDMARKAGAKLVDFLDMRISTKRKEHDALRLRPHPYEFFLYYDV